MLSPTTSPLPYHLATTAQRAQVLHYLQARLIHHFPTLPERARARVLTRALAEFCPDLWYTDDQVALAPLELGQFVQHVAASAEIPALDPPLYDQSNQCLMQYVLHNRELVVWVLPELEASTSPCGPRLLTLLRRVMQPPLVAQQLSQAWRWDVPGGPALPRGIPGGGPAPDSPEVSQRLLALEQASQRIATSKTDSQSLTGMPSSLPQS
ncbi:hypothetical protein QMK33_21330 [Hymenobacter sp. H14-R3]|uniref:hypothetical protein n=1 Tax=Hymenobacter sp. H14-R3 TaxID=3046308 RepID=UPI0024BB36E8|nr:hypothetical protein [Hymenobacter sp. H14-R3]MDJ0367696.1 hypothetical protein [Hymenobacter sp. H14-R3]